ncbi:MAG: hypothetical protein ABI679_14785 [Gemmatimonadota bacterium]
MTANARFDRTRRLLVSAMIVAATGWAIGVSTLTLVVAAALDSRMRLSLHTRESLLVVSALLGIAALLSVIIRNRAVLSAESVALWLEGKFPDLGYSLVTMIEGRFPAAHPALEDITARVPWESAVRPLVVRSVAFPFLVIACGLLVLSALPSSQIARTSRPHVGDAINVAHPRPRADPFDPLVVTVTPPAYSRLRVETQENPGSARGLVGSSVRIEGLGNATGVHATFGTRGMLPSANERGWSFLLVMPDSATAVWLERGDQRRLLVLEPRRDSVPMVILSLPARDSVVSGQPHALPLKATSSDDFGLQEAWFEYIVSSGEGENFNFRSGTVGREALHDRKAGVIEGRLPLDSLMLAPGNIVHIRAVARDGNTTTGPGLGYSDTRTIRIPRPGEADSIAIDAAAPAQGDSSLLSERMLILMAEALERQRGRVTRDTFVANSRRIAGDQAALRRRVSDVIFLRLGGKARGEESEDTAAAPLTPDAMLDAAQKATQVNGQSLDFSEDESPVVALNRPLLEAYNAMWDAGRSLEIGEPRQALPHMRMALEAIQRARQAERLYLRGRPTATVIDLARVRLAGKLADANPARIPPASEEGTTIERLALRFSAAVERLPRAEAIDSLALLRIEALSEAPAFAGSLDRAIEAFRTGGDATGDLIKARRALTGPVRSRPGLPAWGALP